MKKTKATPVAAVQAASGSVSEREELLLTNMLSRIRGEATLWLAEGKGVGPSGNKDVRAHFLSLAKHHVEDSNALRAALRLLGVRGTGPELVFDDEKLTITDAE